MKSFGKWNIPKIELAWASTGTLFYQFIKKVCAFDENRTMYCDKAGRVYIFKKKWIRKKRGMKLVCEKLLETIYPLFLEHLQDNEETIKELNFGQEKWKRINIIWLQPDQRPVSYFGRRNVQYNRGLRTSSERKYSKYFDLEFIVKSFMGVRPP